MFEGIILGIITWLSLILSWWHLPQPVKGATKRHPLLTDLGGSLIAYLGLSAVSKSLVAVVGAIVTGLLINFTLLGAKYYDDNQP